MLKLCLLNCLIVCHSAFVLSEQIVPNTKISPNVVVIMVDKFATPSPTERSSQLSSLIRDGVLFKSVRSNKQSLRENFLNSMSYPCPKVDTSSELSPHAPSLSSKGVKSKSCHHSLPKILESKGYSTSAIGTWHQSIDHVAENFQYYFDVWGERTKKDSPNEAVWMNNGIFRFHSTNISGNHHINHHDSTLPPNEPFRLVTEATGEYDYSSMSDIDIYTQVALNRVKMLEQSTSPLFMYLSCKSTFTSPVSLHTPSMMKEKHPCFPLKDDKKAYPECLKLNELDQSIASLVALFKSSEKWNNTVFLIIAEASNTEDQPSAILSGGFVERIMAVAGVAPHSFKSDVRVSDLHATLLEIVGIQQHSSPYATVSDGSSIESGVSLWQSIVSSTQRELQKANEQQASHQHVARRLDLSNYDILSKFYVSTDGASSWTKNTNWLSGLPCASNLWYGITCISNEVISIDFKDNNLIGTIPSQVGMFTMLSSLILRTNQITGLLPSQLGQFTLLTANFRVDTNSFSGQIPSELGKLSLMNKRLDLYSNLFSGSIPSELGQLSAMTANFRLSFNQLTSTIPTQLGRMTVFTGGLELDSNSLTGTIPTQMGMMTVFSWYLKFSDNSLSGTIPSEFGVMVNYQNFLDLYSNRLTGSLPSQLGMLQFLNNGGSVTLNSNSFCGDIPTQVISTTWDLTNNSFGTPCCETLPLVYTSCAPTSLPTPLPTSVPTLLPTLTPIPTIIPSPEPSALPTAVPLPQPSPLPTSVPSPIPTFTPLPTSVPSSAPTPSPSAVPSSVPSSTVLPTSLPTLPPLPQPSPLPTTKPTTSPTFLPTDLPTDIPTSTPTSQPTATPLPSLPPTVVPTALPTPIPTPLPTLNPTSIPTYFPSLSPTSTPTYLPTLQPSSTPTIAPTVYCESGTYFDGSTCIGCPIGKYTNFSRAPYPSSCSFCPSGQYSISARASSCVDCARGKISSTDRTFCKDCEAGQYSKSIECVSCERGRYAPQPLSDECLVCGNGSYTNNETGSISCTTCDAGSYSRSVSASCSQCDVGKYSSSGATDCSSCPIGFVSANKGATTCVACSAGYHASTTGLSTCSSCVPGKYQDSTGQDSCAECETGRYSNSFGSTVCSYCSVGRSSSKGSNTCDEATSNYYITSDVSLGAVKPCPRHASCLGQTRSPIPDVGYWVDHSSYKYAGDMYRCVASRCKGGTNQSSCWTLTGFTDEGCNNEQCSQGARGPLCGSCEHGYVHNPGSNSCVLCSDSWIFVAVVLGGCGLVVAVVVAMFIFGCLRPVREFGLKVLSFVDTGTIKVLWVTYQIIVSTSFTLNIRFPRPFSYMLVLLSIFSFDFLAWECLDLGYKAYYIKVYFWCLVPFLLAVAIVIAAGVRVLLQYSLDDIKLAWFSSSDTKEKNDSRLKSITAIRSIMNQHCWLLLLLSYMLLPAVSNKQMQSFDCIKLSSGEYYLRVDTSINCQERDYYEFRTIVIFAIILYQSIPILWWFILWRNKKALIPDTLNYDHKLALFIRDNNPDLAAFKFLFVDYKCDKWWFEIADLYRRILFVGVLPLISSEPAACASVGMLLAIFGLVYFARYEPYRMDFTNTIAFVAQVSILVTFYAALTLESVSMVHFGLVGYKLGVFLVIVNLFIVCLAWWFAMSRFRHEQLNQARMEVKSERFERAMGFTPQHFHNVLESMNLQHVSCSEVMVFYYCSSIQAKRARKSGIPASKRFNGIPFTLRRPHDMTRNDFEVFNTSDKYGKQLFPQQEVLVLSIPKRMLEALPGYEHDTGLYLLSAELLQALRPCSFVGVVDNHPWLNLLCLLPPHCILHSYLLTINICDDKLEHNFDIVEDDVPSPLLTSNREWLETNNVSEAFFQNMSQIRRAASALDLIPMYHYTSEAAAKIVLDIGLRMPSGGGHEAGVSLTVKGPCSFDFHMAQYEVNIIKEFFGVKRIQEYKGKGYFSAVIVYGCYPTMIDEVLDRKANKRAGTVSSTCFRRLSLPDGDGNYFLRPDRILGSFLINMKEELGMERRPVSEDLAKLIETEKFYDKQSSKRMLTSHLLKSANVTRIESFFETSAKLPGSKEGSPIPLDSNHSEQEGLVSSSSSLLPFSKSVLKVAPLPGPPRPLGPIRTPVRTIPFFPNEESKLESTLEV